VIQNAMHATARLGKHYSSVPHTVYTNFRRRVYTAPAVGWVVKAYLYKNYFRNPKTLLAWVDFIWWMHATMFYLF